jgi:urease accessory protein
MRLLIAIAIAAFAFVEPAFAHHLMGGQIPATFTQGLLSGLGHPVIGLDHLATVAAVGCLAAWHRNGAALVIGFVVAMVLGVAAHINGMTVPGIEIMVSLCVVALGIVLVRREIPTFAYEVVLFAFAGFINGYAMGESIFGAERTPLYAYLVGLSIIQCVIGLAAMALAQRVLRADSLNPSPLRLVGAGIAGIGIALVTAQIVPAA